MCRAMIYLQISQMSQQPNGEDNEVIKHFMWFRFIFLLLCSMLYFPPLSVFRRSVDELDQLQDACWLNVLKAATVPF